jgi:hypothetical protein
MSAGENHSEKRGDSEFHPELSKIERLHQSGFKSYASFHLAHKANP